MIIIAFQNNVRENFLFFFIVLLNSMQSEIMQHFFLVLSYSNLVEQQAFFHINCCLSIIQQINNGKLLEVIFCLTFFN